MGHCGLARSRRCHWRHCVSRSCKEVCSASGPMPVRLSSRPQEVCRYSASSRAWARGVVGAGKTLQQALHRKKNLLERRAAIDALRVLALPGKLLRHGADAHLVVLVQRLLPGRWPIAAPDRKGFHAHGNGVCGPRPRQATSPSRRCVLQHAGGNVRICTNSIAPDRGGGDGLARWAVLCKGGLVVGFL